VPVPATPAAAIKPATTASAIIQTQQNGIAGDWESNWGHVTFFHPPIQTDKPVAVTGFWQQSPKHRGMVKDGTYDPKTGEFRGKYYQGWNFVHGHCHLQYQDNGTLKGEQVHMGFAWKFPWLLWRTGTATPQNVPPAQPEQAPPP
jgi:hypothetical protein